MWTWLSYYFPHVHKVLIKHNQKCVILSYATEAPVNIQIVKSQICLVSFELKHPIQ